MPKHYSTALPLFIRAPPGCILAGDVLKQRNAHGMTMRRN